MVLVHKGDAIPQELSGGRQVHVHVRGAGGRAARGILLEFRELDWPNLPEPFGRIQTSENGDAVIHIAPRRKGLIWIDEPQTLPMTTEIPEGADELSLTVVESPGRQLKVYGPYGRSVPHARIATIPASSPAAPVALAKNAKSLKKEFAGDEVGTISLPANSEKGLAWLWAPGFALARPDDFSPSNTSVIRVKAAIPFQVLVKNFEILPHESPLKLITCYYPQDMPWFQLKNEAAFTSPPIRVAPMAYPCHVTCSMEGYVPVTIDLSGPPSSGQEEVVLEKGVRLGGHVMDSSGHPISGAYVYFGLAARVPEAMTEEDGSFRLEPKYREDAPYALSIEVEGFLPKRLTDLPAKDNLALSVIMDRGCIVHGRVVEEGAGPFIAGSKVFLSGKVGGDAEGTVRTTDTAGDGTFSISGIPKGAYELKASAARRVAKPQVFQLSPSENLDLGDIVLSSHPSVTGHLVLTGDEEPDWKSASVVLERRQTATEMGMEALPTKLEGEVSQDGTFQIPGVPCGNYRLVAQLGPQNGAKSPLSVQTEDVDVGPITLQGGASLKGALQSSSFQDFSGWRAILSSNAFDVNAPSADCFGDGSFSFQDLPAGDYKLDIFAPSGVTPKCSRLITLAPGEEKTINVQVGGVTVEANLRIEGRPASGGSVTVMGANGATFDPGLLVLASTGGQVILGLPSAPVSAQADLTGHAEIREVQPGPAQATLAFDGAAYTMAVTIPDEAISSATWSFSGFEISGLVLQPNGTPCQGAQVSVSYSGAGLVPGYTQLAGANGAFRISGLGAGALTIAAQDGNGHQGSIPVTITSNGPPPGPIQIKLAATP